MQDSKTKLLNVNVNDFEAVIFDMDGVLINSEALWEENDLDVFQKQFGVLGYTKDYRTRFIGARQEDEMETMVADLGIDREKFPLIMAARQRSLMDLFREKLTLFPGAKEILGFLKPTHKIALASSSSLEVIDFAMEKFNLRNYFQAFASAEEVEHGKPAPDVFLCAARKLVVDPKKCLAIEDSVNGVSAAKAAGMSVVALLQTLPDRERFPHADWIFKNLGDFKTAIS